MQLGVLNFVGLGGIHPLCSAKILSQVLNVSKVPSFNVPLCHCELKRCWYLVAKSPSKMKSKCAQDVVGVFSIGIYENHEFVGRGAASEKLEPGRFDEIFCHFDVQCPMPGWNPNIDDEHSLVLQVCQEMWQRTTFSEVLSEVVFLRI